MHWRFPKNVRSLSGRVLALAVAVVLSLLAVRASAHERGGREASATAFATDGALVARPHASPSLRVAPASSVRVPLPMRFEALVKASGDRWVRVVSAPILASFRAAHFLIHRRIPRMGSDDPPRR